MMEKHQNIIEIIEIYISSSPIIEISAITEFYFAKPSTGTKYNLRNSSHKKIAPNYLSHLGFYVFGGIGGFYFEPTAISRLNYDPSIIYNPISVLLITAGKSN